MQFIDRVTGTAKKTPPEDGSFGRWLVSTSMDEFILLNSVTVEEKAWFVPDSKGAWSILFQADNGTTEVFSGSMTVPADIDKEYVLALAKMLQGKKSWLEWATMSPTPPGTNDELKVHPLDLAIARELRFLRNVCIDPRTYIEQQNEAVVLSRSRKIPGKAASYLAAHTEDWETRTLSGIRPKRILSSVQNVKWDIYENRVVVTLVDHLANYLKKRLETVRKICESQNIGKDLTPMASIGLRSRNSRVYGIWGEWFLEETAKQMAEQRLHDLHSLYYNVAALKDSLLYKNISKACRIQDSTIKTTNIMSNDDCYRHVSVLWQQWIKKGKQQEKSPEERFILQQNFVEGFSDFCLLLVIRALDQLGYCPETEYENCEMQKGVRLRLLGREGRIEIYWRNNGNVRLVLSDKIDVQFVPIPTEYSAWMDSKLSKLLSELNSNDETAKIQNHKIILYLATCKNNDYTLYSDRIRHNQNLFGLPHERRSDEGKNIGFVPVSPWEIESVERVARAIRWYLLGEKVYYQYPPKVNIGNNGLENQYPVTWIPNANNGKPCKIFKPPMPGENEDALMHSEAEIHLKISSLENKRNQSQNLSKAAKQHINLELVELGRLAEKFADYSRQVRFVRDYFRQICTCPVCQQQVDFWKGIQVDETNETFWFTCGSCASKWGLRHCVNCKNKYPAIEPNQVNWEHYRDIPGSIDRIFGMDILSSPKIMDADERVQRGVVFTCPRCGK